MSLSKYLSIHCVLNTVLSSEDMTLNKANKALCPPQAPILQFSQSPKLLTYTHTSEKEAAMGLIWPHTCLHVPIEIF